MKRFIFFALAYIFSALPFSIPLFAQESNLTFPNYVVIGAFAHEKNAITFTDEAKHNRYAARFEMNPNRNLYYVYVLTTGDREYARAEALRLRAETKYFDAWVYSGAFGDADLAMMGEGRAQNDFNPVTGQQLQNVIAGEQQRSSVQTNGEHAPSSNQRQATVPVRRLVANDRGEPIPNSTAKQSPSDQRSPSTHNETPKTEAEESIKDATTGEAVVQQRDGVEPDRNRSTLVEEQQASIRSTGSKAQNNLGNQRRADATVTREDAVAQKQNADGTSEDDQQPALSSDVEPRNNTTIQRQLTATKSVTNAGETQAPKQGGDASQENQNQDTAIADDRKRETSASDETSATISKRNSSSKITVSKTQQASGQSENRSHAPGDTEKAGVPTETDEDNIRQAVENLPPPVRQSTTPLSSDEVTGKNFYFHLYRADNQKTVPGEVDAIDFEKSRKMGTYPANESVKVTMAGGKMKHISFVCQVFGYRKQQQEFDPESPSDLLYVDDKGNLVVPFELVRLQKGDIAIMYNVFFFKDAAVMRPESRYEVNNLLELLEENPSYKIVIHGHTNGNASGKIIRMEKPGNFYSLSGTKQGFGSAKQLSEERALVIREFLISSGISADRMQVKAWGGKKPIHDKHSVRAQENVRVEIEILSQ
ncbi:MAG TPA: OmpA family protein [Chryseosolibacter sp.]|nr:OmpA family protein [Chryseosolibacter sp.]